MQPLPSLLHAKRAVLVMSLYAAVLFLWSPLFTQSQQVSPTPKAVQCGTYVESYKTGVEGYTPFLKLPENAATLRDKKEGGQRYSTALHESAPAANALWLNNWCLKNPLKSLSLASNRLLDALTTQDSDEKESKGRSQKAPSVDHSLVIVLPGQQATPNSCRVGGTKYCSGCSIACTDGTTASCVVGTDSFNRNACFQPANCVCK